MKFCVLISCMYETDHSIVEKSNVQSDCVVVNQCNTDRIDEYDFVNKFGETKHCKFIFTTERGLSRSRNMAMSNAPDDAICKICDDDEILEDNIERIVLDAFKINSQADVIAFSIKDARSGNNIIYPKNDCKLRFLQIIRTSSIQISFKNQFVVNNGVVFDVKMGSGTGNGGGEEIKFLMDIKRRGGKLFYNASCITTLLPGDSEWFKGYTDDFFITKGWTSKRLFGLIIGFLYISYWTFAKRHIYSNDNTMMNVLKCQIKGFFQSR